MYDVGLTNWDLVDFGVGEASVVVEVLDAVLICWNDLLTQG